MITIDKAEHPIANFIFAHGAGAGKDSDFMQDMSARLVGLGITVIRFDFPYMQTIAETGKKRPPDRAPVLLDYFKRVIGDVTRTLPLFIGGKSMGGRMASLLLDEEDVAGGIVFGYPFHPPGKPEKLRTEHLQTLSTPLLILQGERDTFGRKDEISEYSLSKQVNVRFLADGDHSLKPRKASGLSYDEHLNTAANLTAEFISQHSR
ncbi:dienelactone hydrolase family protein [Aestuariibacter sp. AA17]|uniref:Dienelactone hydrolase family protein n=1 Tax=Fluctibacter corallii TaxID=2984329 RepID=A0ABT3AEC0_9ALTE|nr:alpha/beta family hydrolase [Aestuariibacter sp. AA17]MCV2886657.1 dienelactone hydrolase family protein [Aestuariibacter sp. AA17]